MYFYQNCRSVYNFWCLLPSTPSSHKALDNSHNSKFCITRYQTADLRFGISTMYFYQNCRSVYNFWCLLPFRPSNHMALDNSHNSKFCITRCQSPNLEIAISTMYFYQNCKSVYNFWCLLPSRPSTHMALDNTQVT